MQLMWKNFKLLQVLVVVLSLSCPAFLFVVNSGNELVSELCMTETRKDVVITLNHSASIIIKGNHSCVVNIHLLKIKSNGLDIALVRCENHSSISFAFINVTVSMSYVSFAECGAFLSSYKTNLLNSTSLRFLGTHSGFFVFFNSSVELGNITIAYSFGFAILGINMRQSDFFCLHVIGSIGTVYEESTGRMTGSGMMLLFTDSISYLPFQREIVIVNSTFSANYEIVSLDNRGCVSSHFHTLLKPFVINAAALTLIFNVNSSIQQQPSVSIKSSLFEFNTGSYCGGVLILMLNSTVGKVHISNKTIFKNNNNLFKCQGSALVYYAAGTAHSIEPALIVSDTSFFKNDGIVIDDINKKRNKTGAVFIGIRHSRAQYAFVFERVLFHKNIADTFGACLSVVVYDDGVSATDVVVKVILRSVVADNNVYALKNVAISGGGSFAFNNVNRVVIDGSANYPSHFHCNHGSVIHARNTPIHLYGVIKFHDNVALQGAIFLLRDSLLYFNFGLKLEVTKNSVDTMGGAIYSVSLKSYTFDLPNCALQISGNVSCAFTNNKAVLGGSSIFAFPVYHCYDTTTAEIVNSSSHYTDIFNFNTNYKSALNDISTEAHQIIICNYPQCNGNPHIRSKNYFPGQTMSLCVCALDYENGSCVYSVVRVSLTLLESSKYHESSSTIQDSEKIQYLNESSNLSCSIVNVTVSYHDDYKHNTTKLNVVLSSYYHAKIQDLGIPVEICPPGFHFDKGIGVCTCGRATKQFYRAVYFSDDMKCNINLLTFKRPNYIASPWLGYIDIEGKKLFGMTDLCPLDICSTDFSMTEFKYDENGDFFLLSDGIRHVHICREHREGTLCGNCSDGYSVVFGSGECKRCSNWWLWTILLYALTGPLIVYVLYALNLTLTSGTINGIVFYSQAANVGILPFLNYFPSSYHFLKFISIFLSFLNFNLGFSMCFYNGMNEVEKTGLSLIFPIYLLAIIIIIIGTSQYSTWVSNKTSATSVQVLVTVMHISVSKLSVTIIEVFTPTTIYTGDGHGKKVWFRNGNINFIDSSEESMILLMAFTIAIVSLVLLPYFTLLIGGRCLLRHTVFNNYCRAVYEAIHGPYKENRKFWFLAREILLIVMLIIYSVFRGTAIHIVIILTLSLLIVFLVSQEYLKPFKNKMVGILDSSIMLNLITVYLVAFSQSSGLSAPQLKTLVIPVCILVSVVFVTFLFVLAYHILLIWQSSNRYPFRTCKQNIKNEESALLLSNTSQMSFYNSCNKYREPVISFD